MIHRQQRGLEAPAVVIDSNGDAMPFVPGQSGNPGGRAKKNRDIENLALQHCPAAFAEIIKLMTSSKDERIRLEAAKTVLDRGYGKTPQALTLKTPPGGLKVRTIRYSEEKAVQPAPVDPAPTVPTPPENDHGEDP